MKLLSILLFLFAFNFSVSQSVDFETEKTIIKETLSQYLNTNPNSVANYLKAGEGYKMATFGLKMGIATEKDSLIKEELQKDLNRFYFYSDSVSNVLKTQKIKVHISDTLFAYKYVPGKSNLQNKAGWSQNYPDLLADFEKNDMARFDTIMGKDYIDLVKKQINYKGANKPFLPGELNHSYYQFEKGNAPCKDKFCFRANKVYRAVFNAGYTKGCYLFSFYCRGTEICRSFIFVKKENDKWVYVDDYPSWIVDES